MRRLHIRWRQKRIVFIVGNGLTCSHRSRYPEALTGWDSSKPFSFDVPTPPNAKGTGGPLLTHLPHLSAALDDGRKKLGENVTDFDLFRFVLQLQHEHKFEVSVEARHFVALAYSHLYTKIAATNLQEWEWFHWLDSYNRQASLLHVVSFNYDLLVEQALFRIGCNVHWQFRNHRPGVGVFKPHGSINYELNGFLVPPSYPISNFFGHNDGEILLLNPGQLFIPRMNPLSILPSEQSMQFGWSWNQSGFRQYRECASAATHLVIVGFSYQLVDRPEMDYFLDCLNRKAHVHVVDPNPPPAMMEAITLRGFEPRISSIPPELDHSH